MGRSGERKAFGKFAVFSFGILATTLLSSCGLDLSFQGLGTPSKQCGSALFGNASAIQVPANDSLCVYMCIMKNEEVVKTGDPVKLVNNQASAVVMEAALEADVSDIPTGNYQVFYCVCKDEAVGIVQSRLFSLGPFPALIATPQASNSVLLGDTIRLKVMLVDAVDLVVMPSTGRNDVGNVDATWTPKDGSLALVYKNSTGSYVEFVGTKIGTTSVRVDGPRPDLKCSAPIRVNRPVGLGFSDNALDNLIIDVANEFGTPPQIVKAQVWRESRFEAFEGSFRYEMETDYDFFERSAILFNLPYRRYALAGRNAIDQIILFNGDSISILPEDPINQVLRFRSEPDVIVNDTDPNDGLGLSAWELWDQNLNQGWGPRPSSNFTAQVVIASSYGLLHMTYFTAAENSLRVPSRLPSYGGNTAPQRMAVNTSFGTRVGIEWLKWIFTNRTSETFDWNYKWRLALGRYNKGIEQTVDPSTLIFFNTNAQKYVDSVWNRVDDYRPR